MDHPFRACPHAQTEITHAVIMDKLCGKRRARSHNEHAPEGEEHRSKPPSTREPHGLGKNWFGHTRHIKRSEQQLTLNCQSVIEIPKDRWERLAMASATTAWTPLDALGQGLRKGRFDTTCFTGLAPQSRQKTPWSLSETSSCSQLSGWHHASALGWPGI